MTGDLGFVGKDIAKDLLITAGVPASELERKFMDCGEMIYYKTADFQGGGSGCGCAASVLCGYILPKMRSGELKRVLFGATGALMSPTSTMQGESIPSISHIVSLM